MLKFLTLIAGLAYFYLLPIPFWTVPIVLALVMIISWIVPKFVPEQTSNELASDTDEDPSSFMMGGAGGVVELGGYHRDPTKGDCVSALMIMLSETDQLSETFTESDLLDYSERAVVIFKNAMSVHPDDRTLNSNEDVIAVLWALVSERPKSQWLVEHLSDLFSTLGLDGSEFITKSRAVDTSKLLGENWKGEAETIVASVSSEINAFSPEELHSKAARIVAESLKTSKPIPMMLEAYESRSFETWGHFNWDGHFIAQLGLALVRFSGTLNKDKIIAQECVLLCDSGAGGVTSCYLADGPDGVIESIEENLNNISFDLLVGQTTLYLGKSWHVWKNSPYSYTYFCYDSLEIKEYSKGERDVTTVPVIADIKECFVDGPKVISLDDGSNRQEHHWYPYSRTVDGPRIWVFSIGNDSDHVKFDVTDGNLEEVLAFLGVMNSYLLNSEENTQE